MNKIGFKSFVAIPVEIAVDESDAAWATSQEVEKRKRLTQKDQSTLSKIQAMVAKEKAKKKSVAESLKEGAAQHKVLVMVSDPNHTAVTKRKEQVMKKVIVNADDKNHAVVKAKEFYKKKGYKVHDAEYHSPQPKSSMKTESVEEAFADQGSGTTGKSREDTRIAKLLQKKHKQQTPTKEQGVTEGSLTDKQQSYWDSVAKEKKNKERAALNAKKVEHEKTPIGKAEKYWGKKGVAEEVEELEEIATNGMSHQGKTTVKHIKNPTVTQRMAAHDIKPGVAGYRDRIDALRDAKARGNLKEEELDEAKIPVDHVIKSVTKVLGTRGAARFATHLRSGTDKHTSWDKVNSALVSQGIKPQHIANISIHVKPAMHEEVDELSKAAARIRKATTPKLPKTAQDKATSTIRKSFKIKHKLPTYPEYMRNEEVEDIDEGLADDMLAIAKKRNPNAKIAGNVDQQKKERDDMLKKREAERAGQPKHTPVRDPKHDPEDRGYGSRKYMGDSVEYKEVEEATDKDHPIVKEFNALKKNHDIKSLRNLIKGQHKIIDTSEFRTKEHAISSYLRTKHGDKRVADAFGLKEETELEELTTNTLNRYTDAANKDFNRAKESGDSKKMLKRGTGLLNAVSKKIKNTVKTEEYSTMNQDKSNQDRLKEVFSFKDFLNQTSTTTSEELTELSADTLKSYDKKGTMDYAEKRMAGDDVEKRRAGVKKARAKLLAKEETMDDIDNEEDEEDEEDSEIEEAKDTKEIDPKTGKVKSWKHEGDWKKSDKKNPIGKVHQMSDTARRKTADLKEEEIDETMKTTHRNPLVLVKDHRGDIATHANLSVANSIHGSNVKSSDIHSGRSVKSGKHTFTLSKHHVSALKEDEESDSLAERWDDVKNGPDWSKYGLSSSDKNVKKTSTGLVHKARETARNPEGGDVEKRGRGRPAGEHGTYKIDKAKRDDPEYKQKLSQKVMAAKAENFKIRKDFKDSMNSAIKTHQAKLYASNK